MNRIPTAMSSHRRWILGNGIHWLPSQVNPYSNVSPSSRHRETKLTIIVTTSLCKLSRNHLAGFKLMIQRWSIISISLWDLERADCWENRYGRSDDHQNALYLLWTTRRQRYSDLNAKWHMDQRKKSGAQLGLREQVQSKGLGNVMRRC